MFARVPACGWGMRGGVRVCAQLSLAAFLFMYAFNCWYLPRIRTSSFRLMTGWAVQFVMFAVSLFVPDDSIWVAPLLWWLSLLIHQVFHMWSWDRSSNPHTGEVVAVPVNIAHMVRCGCCPSTPVPCGGGGEGGDGC
jgi:hypothetical protein